MIEQMALLMERQFSLIASMQTEFQIQLWPYKSVESPEKLQYGAECYASLID